MNSTRNGLRLRLFIAVFSGVFMLSASACSTAARVRTDDVATKTLARTSPEKVKIYSALDPGRPYEVLGLVVYSKDAGTDSSGVLEGLREQACELGADAVVDADMRVAMGYWESGLTVTGVAVKLQ